jgi:hypothetical protein
MGLYSGNGKEITMKTIQKAACPELRRNRLENLPGIFRIKSRGFPAAITAALILGVLFSGCPNELIEKPGEPGTIPAGDGGTGGYVRVSIGAGIGGRTLLPKVEELFYTLTFIEESDPLNKITETLAGGTSKTVGLSGGTWDLAVQGFRSPVDAGGTPVAVGSADNIVISSGPAADVDIELEASQLGSGSLRYSVTWPSSPAVTDAWLTLDKLDGGYTRTIRFSGSTGASGQVPGLASGFYQLKVYLFNGKIAMAGDLVHIYDNLETPASLNFTAAQFAECPDLSALDTALAAARTVREGVRESSGGAGVPQGVYWVTPAEMDALDGAVTAAEAILAAHGAGKKQIEIDAAVTALTTAADPFDDRTGSYDPATDTDLGLYIGTAAAPEPAAGTTLASILGYLQTTAANNTAYTVLLGADEALPPWTLGGSGSGSATVFNGTTGVTLTLKGKNPETAVSLTAPGSLFTVSSGLRLVLDQNIILRGRTDNTTSLVSVSGSSAALEMKPGSKITGNTSSSSSPYGGGGVFVSTYGTFEMSGGEISGNTSSSGGGVYMGSNGTFKMSGGARVALNNPVYLYWFSDSQYGSITIGGALDGTGPAALVEPAADIGFIGKPFLKWAAGQSGSLPVSRFALVSGWTADLNAALAANAVPLGTPGETLTAYLSRGSVHFYRFTPAVNTTYNVTRTGGSNMYTAAAWADGSGTLSSSFIANKTGVDVVIMVYSGAGVYSLQYTEAPLFWGGLHAAPRRFRKNVRKQAPLFDFPSFKGLSVNNRRRPMRGRASSASHLDALFTDKPQVSRLFRELISPG